MGAILEDITAAVGFTPLVQINKLGSGMATILAKLESFNPCGSVKDRIALSMIQAAEQEGKRRQNNSGYSAGHRRKVHLHRNVSIGYSKARKWKI